MPVNYYEVLGVEESATANEIVDKYSQLLFMWGSNVPQPWASEEDKKQIGMVWALINIAYYTLTDPQLRAQHDRMLIAAKTNPETPFVQESNNQLQIVKKMYEKKSFFSSITQAAQQKAIHFIFGMEHKRDLYNGIGWYVNLPTNQDEALSIAKELNTLIVKLNQFMSVSPYEKNDFTVTLFGSFVGRLDYQSEKLLAFEFATASAAKPVKLFFLLNEKKFNQWIKPNLGLTLSNTETPSQLFEKIFSQPKSLSISS